MAHKEKHKMEQKLAKALNELEESKAKMRNNNDCVDEEEHKEPQITLAPPPTRTSDPEQSQHVDYATNFLNAEDNLTTSTWNNHSIG